ncbi:uncharacterized protein LOC129766703 [Toxorhynchites rutilus septentrionalis]|uniref:uncharacterized protein LOC129766703 n=1 Tax=Toxorhynchites rutilus septentrionalis TaxID=329112 RepID=UPI002478500F|nr:uncharacterized protein LOC129766703 [Toxorhynchites rutilus septentrionalis]
MQEEDLSRFLQSTTCLHKQLRISRDEIASAIRLEANDELRNEGKVHYSAACKHGWHCNFLNVPSTGNKFYNKWCQFMKLAGRGDEKICQVHFQSTDFIEKVQRVLSKTAVPSLFIRDKFPAVKSGVGCCVTGCKTRSNLMLFPSKGNQKHVKAWRKSLKMNACDAFTGLKICARYFDDSGLVTVKRLYLRPNSIPSRRVKKLIKHSKPKTSRTDSLPAHLVDHTHFRLQVKPKSHRMCAVNGCNSRAGNGIVLHKFPSTYDKRYKVWISILRFGKASAKNTKVCSKHFTQSNYSSGGKHLKRCAIRTQNLPNCSQTGQLVSESPYATKRTSYRLMNKLKRTKK